KWLTQEKSVDHVIEHLADANFDPEFYKHYETDIVSKFNSDFGKSITLKKKSLKRIFAMG
ncbi:MAG: NAD(P)/FAD-dependent oxidoreductase, partial [Allomuricauda sp.]